MDFFVRPYRSNAIKSRLGSPVPMVWKESAIHVDDCYFCSINVTRVNKKKCKSLGYRSFPSAIRPVAHGADIPMPEFKNLPDLSIDENSEEEQHDHRELTDVDDDDDDKDFACLPIPVLFDHQSLSGLIRDLSLLLRDDRT